MDCPKRKKQELTCERGRASGAPQDDRGGHADARGKNEGAAWGGLGQPWAASGGARRLRSAWSGSGTAWGGLGQFRAGGMFVMGLFVDDPVGALVLKKECFENYFVLSVHFINVAHSKCIVSML